MQHFRFLPLRAGALMMAVAFMAVAVVPDLSLIHISEPTRH